MSGLRKRSLSIAGHRTSIALEPGFWDALQEIAAQKKVSLAQLLAEADAMRGAHGLASALRLYVLDHYRKKGGA